MHRYDPDYCWDVGMVGDIRLEKGVHVNMNGVIRESLNDECHIYIRLLEDLLIQEKMDGGKKNARKK